MIVMAGLDPAIHGFLALFQGVDARNTPGTKCPGAGMTVVLFLE